ncbi:DJ-1/PfpI family protein [Bacillus oleivorans]|uniref:DJ-1/PfpI family protein n=1 Tax=Bacillus oleivorans TaxID=1448271 RepID=A0A285CT85_9BACI|nr:DJ-1/PfpI family protein [Bacillus oleivorans]SNX70777.1 DJ-1/PfpI family protein [Bacillus oleivorans]
MNIQIVLFDGFDLLDAIAPYEVFTAAAMYSDEAITVKLVSAEGKRMVSSGVNQLKLQASGNLELTCKGIILVPGASGSVDYNGPDSVPVKLKQAAETELSNLLREAIKKPDILLSTVCGGSLILAMAGLLEGRHAVTHHMGMGLLGATNAIPVHARIVEDGNLVTSGGVTSGLDLALYLVERELGPRIAHAVEQLFEYERRGTVWKAVGNTPKASQQEEDISKTASDHAINQTADKVHFQGKWDTIISTPIGKLSVLFDLSSKDGRIVGAARQGEEIVPLENPELEGNQLKWSMKVTKPMRLTLKFNVWIDGNNIYGEAKAGMLPASKLMGHRIS